MSKIITFSRTYPSYHPKAGEPTYFVEKFYRSFSVEACGELFALPITVLDLCQLNPHLSYGAVEEFHKSLRSWGSVRGKRPNIEPKFHTIRAGHRFKVGDKFSPRVWSGAPYRSKQITFAPDIELKKIWNFEIRHSNYPLHSAMILDGKTIFDVGSEIVYLGGLHIVQHLSENDGLDFIDFRDWFQFGYKPFDGQIICWNENVNY